MMFQIFDKYIPKGDDNMTIVEEAERKIKIERAIRFLERIKFWKERIKEAQEEIKRNEKKLKEIK